MKTENKGFTLIELLVVVAIIALLIGILLPALGAARGAAQAMTCATNARTVAQAVAVYGIDNDYFPPSYVYGANETGGEWRVEDQLQTNPHPANGYIHWSWALFGGEDGGGNIPESAFECPTVLRRGAPATNPGPDYDDWEDGQYNDLGSGPGSDTPNDRQAARMAYTGNAAIFPRNKYNISSQRKSQLVKVAWVDSSRQGASKTILCTEFYDNKDRWTSLKSSLDGKIKSHRPITPFIGRSAGTNVYDEPKFGSVPRFVYPPRSAILDDDELGANVINSSLTTLNAVGRHHNGKTNFSFVDGHVETLTVQETVRKRLWGDRFYSITGGNKVDLELNKFD